MACGGWLALAVIASVRSPALAASACASCELVPCGMCQDGCTSSVCETTQPAVDKAGATSRNGCGRSNDGQVPTKCRVPSPAAPLPCVLALPRAFHWDVEPHSVKVRWGTDEAHPDRENLSREWLELIDRTRAECLNSSTTVSTIHVCPAGDDGGACTWDAPQI